MKLIACIFEGISYDLLNKYMDKNLLNNFKRLCSNGSFGELECNTIPYEASGIITAFSGKNVYEHGFISYWNPKPKDYIPIEWNSNDIKELMFWNQTQLKDYNYVLMNLFGTQPAYEINGAMLSYSMEKNLRFSYPKDLLWNMNKKKIPYVQDTCAFFNMNTEKSTFCKDVLKIDMLRKNAFLELIKDNADVGIVNFTAIDRLSHFCFDEISQVKLEDSLLYKAYKQCDDFLGEIMGVAEKKRADILVFSEIGFGHLKKFVRVNDYLVEKKLMKCDINTKKTIWDKTIAFESVQGSHGININKKGVYNKGLVSDGEYANTLDDVMNILKDMPNPYNNNPMFKKVIRGAEFSMSCNVPDIILEPYDWEYIPYGDSYWANHVSRDCQTGWHRSNSFWGALGPISTFYSSENKKLVDIFSMIKEILSL